eukprot:TRINITY_DN3817_c0_g1_i1.p1 TRINITY_DN3817_c0_g1~~TRINITY_DN3817_c0_g1_i1.p1  ORF type:complete len:143 (+),score=32.08 TRINITY_DN3817_c0_g1_i1:235-663(+)
MNTVGIDFKEKLMECKGHLIKLQIWDTAGQERFRSITHSYFRGAQGYILVYDVTQRNTFNHIRYWLSEIRNHGREGFYTIIVGNKTDMNDRRVVSTEEGKAFAMEQATDFLETSAKDGQNVQILFERSVEAYIIRNPSIFGK